MMRTIDEDTDVIQDVPDAARELPNIDSDPRGSTPRPGPANSTLTKVLTVGLFVLLLGGSAMALFWRAATSPLTVPSGNPNTSASDTATDDVGQETKHPPADLPGIPLPGPAAQSVTVTPTTTTPTSELDDLAVARAERHEQAEAIARLRQDLTARADDLDRRLSALAGQFQGIERRLNDLGQQLDSLDQRPAESSLAQRIDQLTGQLAALTRRLESIDRRSRANARRITGEAGARWRGRRLPFTVESVDWWGETPSVAVTQGDRRRFLTAGDTIAGWRLVSIDPALRAVRFERNGFEAVARVAR